MNYDFVIIGAGIVGLATARALHLKFPKKKILMIEKEIEAGYHQSGHNSGVIHSGIYYKPGSRKAVNCARGYKMLLDFLRAKQIHFEICGKLIVATTESERSQLISLKSRGEANGLSDLKIISSEEAIEREPHVFAKEALWVPQAGIVDYRNVVQALFREIEKLGGEFKFGVKVFGAPTKGVLETSVGSINFKKVINCAGLYSDRIGQKLSKASDLAAVKKKLNHRIVPIRGEYYQLAKEREFLVRNLIYPVPDMRFPFLGVHFTRMSRGGVEAGPNAVLALSREGYSWGKMNLKDIGSMLLWPGTYKMSAKYWDVGLAEVARSLSKSKFVESLQKLIPEIQSEDLVTGGAGVRAQALTRNGALLDDFLIEQEGDVINVYNAPSPAATSSLSIGESIVSMIV